MVHGWPPRAMACAGGRREGGEGRREEGEACSGLVEGLPAREEGRGWCGE